MKHLAWAAFAACIAAGGGIGAQVPHEFEVASVKRNTNGDVPPRFLTPEPGGLRVVNLPLFTILWMAHGVQSYQIVDAPDWTTTEAYDIVAKAPPGTALNIDTFRPMLRTLLAERFQMKTRTETRELPVYNLVRVAGNTALGPELSPSSTDCTGRTTPPATAAPPSQPCGVVPRAGSSTTPRITMFSTSRSNSTGRSCAVTTRGPASAALGRDRICLRARSGRERRRTWRRLQRWSASSRTAASHAGN
jgi:uncharacterized protein (TIGR03435 family)